LITEYKMMLRWKGTEYIWNCQKYLFYRIICYVGSHTHLSISCLYALLWQTCRARCQSLTNPFLVHVALIMQNLSTSKRKSLNLSSPRSDMTTSPHPYFNKFKNKLKVLLGTQPLRGFKTYYLKLFCFLIKHEKWKSIT